VNGDGDGDADTRPDHVTVGGPEDAFEDPVEGEPPPASDDDDDVASPVP
jgi:hypothetical protein